MPKPRPILHKPKLKIPLEELSPVERLRIVSMTEAARLSSLSVESILRHHADHVIDLSPRRKGMRLQDALSLSDKQR